VVEGLSASAFKLEMKTSKFQQALKLLFISATLALVSLGGWLIYGFLLKTNTQAIAVRSVVITQGQVEDKITGESGILKLDNQRTVKPSATGTVEQILVKNGDLVRKDQILVRLRDRESQIKLQEFESDLKDKTLQINEKKLAWQRAEKKLFDVTQESQNIQKSYLKDIESKKQEKQWEVEKRKLEVKKKQQAISQAENDLAEARVKLEEDKQLFTRGFISENELKDQEKKVSQTETILSNVKDELSVSKIDLEKQELDLQTFLKSVNENTSEPQQKLKDVQYKIEQYQQDVNLAKLVFNQVTRELDKLKIQRQKIIEELHKTVITSPADGVIINIQLKVGDVIEQKGDVLLMGDPRQQIVELKLSPLDATKVKLRQQAEISIIGLEAKKITGKVQQISLLATETQSNNNQGYENVKVTAIVRLDQVIQNIIPGTPVMVTLIISRRDKVLVLPNEAIQQAESGTFVWRRDTQSIAFKRFIKIGLEGLDNVEI
jgi:HlyD family secretion protein